MKNERTKSILLRSSAPGGRSFEGTWSCEAIVKRSRPVLGLAARLIIGGVFLYSGFLKLTAPPEEFAAAIEAYRIIPPSMAIWAAHAVSWSELYLGMFLVAGFFTKLCSMALGSMLAVFIFALASTLLRNIKLLDCGCFGSGGGRTAPFAILEDIVLLLITALAFLYGHKLLAVDKWIHAGDAPKINDGSSLQEK